MTHATRCADFDRWLDQGADAAFAPAMRAHAADCARCGEALAATEAIDAWLEASPVAPARFSDRVMARIERLEQARPTIAWSPVPADDLPWWTAILRQPAVVLAAMVAALVLWRGDALIRLTLTGASSLGSVVSTASARALGGLGGLARNGTGAAQPEWLGTGGLLAIGLAVGLTPVLLDASSAVGRWVARRVIRPARPA
jgi:hypothetical protein